MSDQESLSDIMAGSSAFVSSTPAEKAEPAKDVTPEPAKAEAAAPSAAKVEEPAKAEKPAQARDDSGKFTKPEEKPEPMVPLSALLAERAKRREPEAGKPKTSVFDDEDKGISERVAEHVGPLEKQVFDLRLQLAKTQHADFDDAVMAYLKVAQNDESLRYQADNAPDPLAFIYREGKRLKELAPFDNDLGKYREHVTAQTKAELDEANKRITALAAEVETLKKSQAQLSEVPSSLNSIASGASPKAGDADPEDIGNIVRFGKTG